MTLFRSEHETFSILQRAVNLRATRNHMTSEVVSCSVIEDLRIVNGNLEVQTKSKKKRRQISIRLATIRDCRQCTRVLLHQLAEHGADASEGKLNKTLERVLSDKTNGFILVARSMGNIVGVAYVAIILSAEHCGKVGWLEELYVMPEYRSKGIGGALLIAVLEQARKLGIVAIDLEVDAAHRRVESLYRRFGFRPLDRSRWVRTLLQVL